MALPAHQSYTLKTLQKPLHLAATYLNSLVYTDSCVEVNSSAAKPVLCFRSITLYHDEMTLAAPCFSWKDHGRYEFFVTHQCYTESCVKVDSTAAKPVL